MPTFQLFRIRVIFDEQTSMLSQGSSPSEIIRLAVLDRPSSELRLDYWWHIGNVEEIEENVLLFAIGRTTSTTSEQYDETMKNFIYTTAQEALFTYAFIDTDIEVCAIGIKARLTPPSNRCC